MTRTSSLRRSRTALLTTFRRDGRPVPTPVSIALDDENAYFVTPVDSGKAKRIRHDPRLTLAPSTVKGTPLGPAVAGKAILVNDARRSRRLLRPNEPLFWSWLLYRIQGKPMALYEVRIDDPP